MLHRTYSGTARHILSYAQTMRGGGVERALLRMADGWLRAGRRVTLVLGSDEGPLAAEISQEVELIHLGDPRYPALFGLADHVRKAAPDLIFCPGNHYSAVAALTRLRLGRGAPPIVAKVSNALVRPEQKGLEAWAYRRWLRLHPRFLDHVVAMTPAMAAEAIAEMHIPRARVSVIANPPTTPRPDAAPVKLPEGRYIVGVGRLERQKRWDRLIDALARIGDRDVELLIIGEGSLRSQLEAQIAALELSGRVSLPGHAGDPLPALAGAAVAVLTSDYEGVPGVLREALSVGTPVVSTESSVAVREIVAAPELGTVVPREDGAALVAALRHWLAPGRARPAPVVAGGDPIADYLALFDRLVSTPHARS
ncbi:glycosyltransferase [Sphingomonas psychrotolerans]|uniref:Glycosyltransferase n=1 Tax=Sphingomonas psychrotolerans TaxID=1327635 RepID=A0ABU3N7Q7_9SPHN|nr:glycosyltransferase [Sphingomonas psychrotolerans]MDT8760433.1 glycosyltransferase [Sphingomonas psychrotolerans]